MHRMFIAQDMTNGITQDKPPGHCRHKKCSQLGPPKTCRRCRQRDRGTEELHRGHDAIQSNLI